MKQIVRWAEIRIQDTADDRGLFHQEHDFKKYDMINVMKQIVRWTEIRIQDTTDDRGLFHQEHDF